MLNATNKSVILYVDDDDDDCVFLKTSLEEIGTTADLICSPDGEDAVQYLNSVGTDSLPSLIVLDLNMPRWDGRKTLCHLKADPRLAAIPVIMLSTSESEKEREACRQMGAASYYKKPYHYNDYRNVIAGFFAVIQA